jgi:hypothetical protein
MSKNETSVVEGLTSASKIKPSSVANQITKPTAALVPECSVRLISTVWKLTIETSFFCLFFESLGIGITAKDRSHFYVL